MGEKRTSERDINEWAETTRVRETTSGRESKWERDNRVGETTSISLERWNNETVRESEHASMRRTSVSERQRVRETRSSEKRERTSM